MLSSKEKSYLRGMAQTRKAIVMIGKDGIGDKLCATLSDSLEAHELVKVSCLKTSPISTREAAIQCACATHSEIVNIIGHTFVLYRKSEKEFMSTIKVGLLGGSFDPIHKGHLELAKAILKDGCQEVWLLPCVLSPFKSQTNSSFHDRVEMIQRAICPFKKMKVCTIEETMSIPSYSVHTLQKLKEKYTYEFIFYIGNDQAKQLNKWKDIEECMKLAEFRVFKRDGDEVECDYDLKIVNFDCMDISSTKVRQGAFYDVPETVRDYIWTRRLYLDEFVKANMNEKRYNHSVSVANVCKELAISHHLNEEDAYTVGLLHDICKCWNKSKSEAWMKCYESEHINEPVPIWHGYLSDHYLKKVFKIREKHILKAVHHHVIGDCSDPYAQIVFIADKCDPLRGYDVSEQLALSKRNLNQAVELVKKQQQEYIKKEQGE